MKKIISLLSVIAVVAGNCSIQAKAFAPYIDVESWTTTENGCPWDFSTDGFGGCHFRAKNWSRDAAFLAVTTSEGLPENCTDAVYTNVMEWDELKEYLWNENSFGVYLDYQQKLQEDYGENARFYYIIMTPSKCQETPYYCRKFASLHEEVTDTFLIERRLQGECYWSGTYAVSTSQKATKEIQMHDMTGEEIKSNYPEVFGEDSILEQSENGYQEWKENYLAYKAENQNSDKTRAEQVQEMALLGISNSYPVMQKACETAEKFYEENKENVSVAFPEITIEEAVCEYRPFSAWEHVGDLNGDEKINASDASKILTLSAMQGSGTDTGLSIEEQQFADVNADGIFNAKDAAVILQYSASVGCGEFNGTLAEFIKIKTG